MLNLIPYPRRASMSDERTVIRPRVVFPSAWANAYDTLRDYASRIHGVAFLENKAACITLTTDNGIPSEGYVLEVSEGQAAVRASDVLGAQNAVSTLLQLMRPTGDGGVTLPIGCIEDAPECSWRGVMIDLARVWHPLPMLYEYVDLCRFYKIKYLHLHFTDDQSYTLPSRAFPKLSTEGRHYTEAELVGLMAYATRRGVEIIPEIDVPGHTTSFSAAYGDVFGTDGIICQNDAAMLGIEVIFRELCALFSDSQYIHVGGDEAVIAKWTECPRCLDAYRARGVDVNGMDKSELAELMYATFVKHTCEAVLSCGKTPVVWEGFREEVNHLIPREAVIMSWENLYQTTPQLRDAGFRLVNCSWSPMYIVHPAAAWSPKEIFDWNVCSWTPVHPDSPYHGTTLTIEPTEQVEGGQLLAWGDHIVREFPDIIEGVRGEQRKVEERTPALAENTWNRQKVSDFDEFSVRCEQVAPLCGKLLNHKV